jgi:hypothetical protein
LTAFVLATGQVFIGRYLAAVAALGLLWIFIAIAFGRWLWTPRSERTKLAGIALAMAGLAVTVAFLYVLLS